MDLTAIREGLATAVDAVPSLQVFAFPPDQVPVGNTPVAVITPGSGMYVDYNQAFNKGLGTVMFTVVLYVQYVAPKYAFAALEAFCSSGTGETNSIIDTVMDGDRTLGGVCSDLVFDRVSNIIVVTNAEGVRYLSAELDVRVLAART